MPCTRTKNTCSCEECRLLLASTIALCDLGDAAQEAVLEQKITLRLMLALLTYDAASKRLRAAVDPRFPIPNPLD
jgi:hypothetical protein